MDIHPSFECRWFQMYGSSIVLRAFETCSFSVDRFGTRRYLNRYPDPVLFGEIFLPPGQEAVIVVGDSAQYCHLLPGVRRFDRWIRPGRVPPAPLDSTDTLDELIDHDNGLGARFLAFFRPSPGTLLLFDVSFVIGGWTVRQDSPASSSSLSA